MRRNPERKKEEEKCRGWLRETDNNYTCPRRPREPDHVAIETQVQQKVTGKSIQIELISPSLPSHLTGATKHILTVAALMQHKPQQCLLPLSFSSLSTAATWIINEQGGKIKSRKCATTRHKSPSVSGTPFILAPSSPSTLHPPSLTASPALSEGQWQLRAGDKRVQRRGPASDWLARTPTLM